MSKAVAYVMVPDGFGGYFVTSTTFDLDQVLYQPLSVGVVNYPTTFGDVHGAYYFVSSTVYFVPDEPLPSAPTENANATSEEAIIYGTAGNETINAPGTVGYVMYSGVDTSPTGTGDDTINGSSGKDYIYVGDGNDTVYAGDGDDILGGWGAGTSGNNTLHGEGGDDSIVSGTGDDTIYGGSGDDWIYLANDFGNDVIHAETGFDTLDLTEMSDAVTVDFYGDAWGTITDATYTADFSGVDAFNLGSGDDFVTAGADTSGIAVDAGDGDDTVWGGVGDDSIWGGAGADEIYGDTGDDIIYGEAGIDDLGGDAGNDYIDAGAGDDTAQGGADTDLVIGGLGDDDLLGDGGDDVLIGDGYIGDGTNLLVNGSFEDTTGMSAQPWGYSATGSIVGWTTLDGTALIDVHDDERAGVEASDGSHWLDMDGDLGDQLTIGQDVAGVVDGEVYVLSFDAGDFTNGDEGVAEDNTIGVIWNGDLIAVIDPGEGALASYDFTLVGGTGDGSNRIEFTSGGADDQWGATLDNVSFELGVSTGTGDDRLEGGTGDDVLVGGEGFDTFVFGDSWGSDVAYGGGGDDDTLDFSAVTTGSVNVTFTGTQDGTASEGANALTFTDIGRVVGSDQGDTIDASSDGSGLALFGGGGGDTITGGSGDDVIEGGAGSDALLSGGAGADTITGGTGADNMSGGADNDTFVLTGGIDNDTISGGETTTTGTDWDIIDLTGVSSPLTIVYSSAEDGTISDGTDTITFSGIETMWLGNGGDVIDASAASAAVWIWSMGGNDSITAGAGNDVLYAGAGDDIIVAGAGDNTVRGNDGSDTIVITDAGGDSDILGGEDTGDLDALTFSNDIGTSGVNVTFDGSQSGTYSFGASIGTFAEIEVVSASEYNDVIDASLSSDDQMILGFEGDDIITGGTGDDILSGGLGDDTLTAGAGTDTLTGGSGDDTFAISDGDQTNTIVDFDTVDDDLDGFTNDQLDLSGLTDAEGNPVHAGDIVVSDDGSGNAVITANDGTTITLMGVDPGALDAPTLVAMGVPCFTEGTVIDTSTGPRKIEDIDVNDMIRTVSGEYVPVVWRDHSTLKECPDALRPIEIKAGALGDHGALRLSPQHRVVIGPRRRFAPARWLAEDGGGAFRVAKGQSNVTYHHLMLPRHAVIFANGCEVESFYPGPEALGAISVTARARLFHLEPTLARILTMADAARYYGPLARPQLKRHELDILVTNHWLAPAAFLDWAACA